MTPENLPPFYIGQKVVGSGYAPGSRVNKGHIYTIKTCRLLINPANGTGPYWYIGVLELPGNEWTTPKLYLPIYEIPLMTFAEIKEVEKFEILIPN